MSDILDGLSPEDLSKLSHQSLSELQQHGTDTADNLSVQALQELDALHATSQARQDLVTEKAKPMSKTESAMHGLTNFGTSNFAPEISGAEKAPLGAVKSIANKFGFDFDDPDVQKYIQSRDEYKQLTDKAYKDNPWSYRGGAAVGAILPAAGASKVLRAATGVTGLKNLVQGAALSGAATGAAGSTDYKPGQKEDSLLDMTNRAAMGYAGGELGAGVSTAVGNKIGDAFKYAGKAFKSVPEAAEYAKSQNVGVNLPLGVNELTYGKNFVKGIGKVLGREDESASTMKTLADESRKLLSQGGEAVNPTMSDEEAIISALSKPGQNPIKEYIATKSTSLPGRAKTEDVQSALNMSPEEFNEALNFQKRNASNEIAPEIQKTLNLLKKDKGQVYGNFKKSAAGDFDKREAYGVVEDLQGALADAQQSGEISGSVQKPVMNALNAIKSGKALSQRGLTPKTGLGVVDAEEALNRLHAGRQIIDDALEPLRGSKTVEERFLSQIRKGIDQRIKKSPSMEIADKVFSQGSGLQQELFDPFMRKVGPGKYEVDTAKLAKAFGDNDTAQRLKDIIPRFKKYISANDDVFPNSDDQISALEKLEGLMGTADKARIIEKARANPSGTASAVNRTLRGDKTNFLEDLINSPIDTAQSLAQFKKAYAPLLGKEVKDLGVAEQLKLSKMYLWNRNNPNATQKETEDMFRNIIQGN